MDVEDHAMIDSEAVSNKVGTSHEEIVHLAELSEEEKILEKKLRLRIDLLIMPPVIMVYLLNFIDR